MKAKVYIGAKKYAVYIGRKIVEKTMNFFSFPARFFAAKDGALKDYKMYGKTVQSNLPEGYVQLEYIESTTSQYINTGIKGELESELTFIGQRTGDNPNQNYGHLWGDLSTSARSLSFNTPKTASASGSSRFGDKATSSNTSPIKVIPLNTPVTIIQNKEGATASTGFEIAFDTTTAFETDNPLLLFTAALSGGGPTASSHKWRCEYFSHKKGGVLVQEFIPCKNAQGEIGMYDTVSGNFFANKSSTPFVAGPEAQPTPTEPIAIESVGDKTKNLFNQSTIVPGKYIDANGRIQSNSRVSYSDLIEIEPGVTYVFSGINQYAANTGKRVHGYDAEGKWLLQLADITVAGIVDYALVFTPTAECKYVRVSGMTRNTDIEETTTVQVEKGTTATAYEPYGMYKIPVNIVNKNMLNPNAEVYNGYIGLMNVGEAIKFGSSTASKTYKKFAYFKPGTYTYSYNGSASTGSLRFVLCDENEIVREIVSTPVVQGRNEVTVNFTKEGWGYVSALVVATDIQIEEGDTATAYEPYFNQTTNIYLSEPLRKLGDLTDYIDYAEQKVVRNVKSTKLSSLDWVARTEIAAGIFATTSLTDRLYSSSALCLIDCYSYKNTISAGSMMARQPDNSVCLYYITSRIGNTLYVKDTNASTPAELLERVGDNNLYYQLETPTEESITLPTIALQQGNMTMDIETKIKPSQLTITGDIDDVR